MSIVRLGAKAIDTSDPVLGQVLASAEGVSLGSRNIIINGDMRIAQRGTSATGVTSSDYYTIDRWKNTQSNDATLTISQVTDAPANTGLVHSYKVDVTTADTSIAATQYQHIQHTPEALNCQHLMYGTVNAKTITLSFYVKSNKTGTYGFCLSKVDTTRYDYVAEYTINAANTWERKIITIVPDSNIKASGGAIANDNGIGFRMKWILASGTDRQGTANTWHSANPKDTTSNQVNFLDNTANEFFLTGCQLEVGTEATEFEHTNFSEELRKCQRYFYLIDATASAGDENSPIVRESATQAALTYFLPTNMRSTPSVEGSNYGRIVGYTTSFGAAATATVTNMTVRTNINDGQKIDLNLTHGSFAGGRVFSHHDRNAQAGVMGLDAEL